MWWMQRVPFPKERQSPRFAPLYLWDFFEPRSHVRMSLITIYRARTAVWSQDPLRRQWSPVLLLIALAHISSIASASCWPQPFSCFHTGCRSNQYSMPCVWLLSIRSRRWLDLKLEQSFTVALALLHGNYSSTFFTWVSNTFIKPRHHRFQKAARLACCIPRFESSQLVM